MNENNINCEIVKDLLPLYHDNVVSDTTAIAVEEHLNNCEECSKEYDNLCTELIATLSNEEKGVKTLLKSIKHKGLIKGIIIAVLCIAVLISSFYVLTQVPLKNLSEDKVYATRVYKCDGVFFVFYNQKPAQNSAKEVLSKDGKELDISIKTPVFDLESYFKTDKEKSKVYKMDWITNNCYEDVNKLTLNGKPIWTEKENGDDEVPDYIKDFVYYPVTFEKSEESDEELLQFGNNIKGNNNESSFQLDIDNGAIRLMFDYDKNRVTAEYNDGTRKVWSLDGILINDKSDVE